VGQWAGVVLLACETAFLVSAGAPLWSSSPSYLAPTPAEAALTSAVGSSVVGFGTNTCFSSQLGIVPDLNVAFKVRELAAYEPLLPMEYGVSWRNTTGQPAAPVQTLLVPFTVFCPAVTTSTVARRYGVGFILEPARAARPSGTVFDRVVGGEDLYRVPGAGLATLTPARATGPLPGPDATGAVVPVTQRDPASLRLQTHANSPQVLRLRLTAAPGWHASIDGRPLTLHIYSGVMLQARIPSGRHVVELSYWPTAFTAGIVVAGTSAVGLGVALLVAWVHRRRRVGTPTVPS
jgi:hypothetical protein